MINFTLSVADIIGILIGLIIYQILKGFFLQVFLELKIRRAAKLIKYLNIYEPKKD